MSTRILIDARMLSGPVHGIARYAYSVATGVARLRPEWTVGVWTHQPKLWEKHRLKNIVPVMVQARPFSLREHWELPQSALAFRSDLVHFCSIAVPFWLPRRSVVTVHDLTPLHFPRSRIHTLLLKYVTGSILRRVPKILCGSHYTSQDIQQHLNLQASKIEVIYYGGLEDKIAVEATDPVSKKSDKPYFLCVSNPKPHKNLKLLLASFRPLEKDFELIIVSPSSSWLDLAVAGRSSIRRLHGLSDEAMTELYRNALAVVVPSLYEGFGIPVLEAMQLGVPVVSSHATSLPEVVGEAGLLFDPQNSEELTQQLWKIGLNPELRQSLRLKGIIQASKFSWAQCALEHAKVFEKLVNTP